MVLFFVYSKTYFQFFTVKAQTKRSHYLDDSLRVQVPSTIEQLPVCQKKLIILQQLRSYAPTDGVLI